MWRKSNEKWLIKFNNKGKIKIEDPKLFKNKNNMFQNTNNLNFNPDQ